MNLNKKQKIIILSMLSLIVFLLALFIILPDSKADRTIMIYLDGSNLESESKIVTAELAAIDPKKIDLEKTNVLLYTGGTKKWHNFISNEENAIYILKTSGFEKIKTEEKYNLGDPQILTNFLKYGYDNYKADKYDLILYDHGGAIDGAIYDDFSNDNLSIEDMSEALNNSPFNNKNKLETIVFRTCLNGSIELANTFASYAKYFVASEEISYGRRDTNVLGFINDLLPKDNGETFGIKFVDAYEKQMTVIDNKKVLLTTYSVIDLSKLKKVNNELDKYITSIDLKENYSDIAKVRANMYQYGDDAKYFDMIDLYYFVKETSKYAKNDGLQLLKAIENAVIYNKTNDENSHGLSIYFPFNGTKGWQTEFINEVYTKLNYSEIYKNFINSFYGISSSPSTFKFDVTKNEIKKDDPTKRTSLQLDKEQIENYSSASFTLFQQVKDHPRYYQKLLKSDNVTLSSDGLLTANYENSLVKLLDSDDGEYKYMVTTYKKANNERTARAILYDYDIYPDPYNSVVADIYISNDKNNKPFVSNAKLISDNERIDGTLLKLDGYDNYLLVQNRSRILDDDGNVMDSTEWESPPEYLVYTDKMDNLYKNLKYSDLDKGDDYYILFMISDIHNNISYSKLIKVGE